MQDSSSPTRPVIALTMGDPAGVGPELVLRALNEPALAAACRLAVFGDLCILRQCSTVTGVPLPQASHTTPPELSACLSECSQHCIVDLKNFREGDLPPLARVSAECGRASFDYIQAAIDAALSNEVAAVTTAPINKEALRAAGLHYPGHTEMFAERAPAPRWCMMQYSEEITCTFVTVHVGYAEVPQLLTTQRVLDTIELTAAALRTIRGIDPRLVVCGLNPHAGENGLFGDREEERIIIPAIEQGRQLGIDIEGPLPPDTAFLASKRRQTDAFVCMYHDQGHIPVKALAFETAVNTTLGLRVIRTSVDHGTAFDIAWKGTAAPGSLYAAIQLATQLTQKR